jgi:tetratricopeptide (TPR) repeat protein
MARDSAAAREQIRTELTAVGASVPQIVAELHRRLGMRPRVAWRAALGWQQWRLVMEYRAANPHDRLTESRLSNFEQWPHGGSKPSLDHLAGLALTFGHGCTPADLVDAADLAQMKPSERFVLRPEATTGTPVAAIDAPLATIPDPEVAEVEQQRAWLSSLHADAPKLGYLAGAVGQIIAQGDMAPVAQLDMRARALRAHLQQMLREPHHPPVAQGLYTTAAYLSGAQAALAIDLGRLEAGRSYAREAFDLADATGDVDLMAWARAAQSLVEYYDGQYLDALALADDGLQRSPRGVHAVRLSVNGRARALGKMGDHDGVERAVDHAWAVREEHAAPEVEMSANMTNGVYCESRTAGNAATAYLALGDAEEVERYATLALRTFDRVGATHTQAMTRLDIATVLLNPGSRELDRATGLVTEALEITAGERKYPVVQRTGEFLAAAEPWHALPAVREVRELVADSPH